MKKKKLSEIEEFNKISKKLDKMEDHPGRPIFIEMACLIANTIPFALADLLKIPFFSIISIPLAIPYIFFIVDLVALLIDFEKNVFIKHYNKKHDKLFKRYQTLGLSLGLLREDIVAIDKDNYKIEIKPVKNQEKLIQRMLKNPKQYEDFGNDELFPDDMFEDSDDLHI